MLAGCQALAPYLLQADRRGPRQMQLGLPAVGSLLPLTDPGRQQMAPQDANSEYPPLAACSPYLTKQPTKPSQKKIVLPASGSARAEHQTVWLLLPRVHCCSLPPSVLSIPVCMLRSKGKGGVIS